MATLLLSSVGSALGAAAGRAGFSILGGAVSPAALGRAAGALAGSLIDNALTASSGQARILEGPRLNDLQVSASTEGSPIPRLYGRARLAGQLIWATRFEEQVTTTAEPSSGGKGLGGGSSARQSVTRVDYSYFANVAYALCEGEVSGLGRIWADGKELDQSQYTIRLHGGGEDQQPDALIEAKQGAGNAPAYRGTAYVVFERMALERFGNRLPQLNFEVFRAVDSFEDSVRAINVIPSAGEFVYAPQEVLRDAGGGSFVSENRHSSLGATDWQVSLGRLSEQLPNAKRVSLVVSWFGDDLRLSQCRLEPRVEVAVKATTPQIWQVAGLDRSAARVVSTHDGAPAYGGTPSDASVVAAIQDLKARGFDVAFNPFILMDVPAGNTLTDPYTGAAGQPAYPWRGRITVDPAPGVVGSPDKSAAAKAAVDAFVGAALPADFQINGTSLVYSGPSEWSYRRMVLHYAHLCAAAGGIDVFFIGSELRGATWIRDGASSYPFVAALIALAADVRAVLGASTKLVYAADWSEYFGHQPVDGSGDVHFHLDPLWASADIDAIGIDLYWPLSDWREGDTHLDRQAGARSIYELDYLKGNISGGEGFDWYYASDQDRDGQLRTPIGDGGYGKPWVFRYKDIKSWWENQHYDRPGGVEAVAPTAWVPQSKPIWFTELGCPAVDKGSNQPNVFVDPKSSESELPHYARKIRDDLIQRRYIQAVQSYFDPADVDYAGGSNPVSSLYGSAMVDIERIYVYTWDARPYPAFPYALDVWADGGNWEFGHWLTGRLAGGPLAAVVAAIMGDYGFTSFAAAGLAGEMDGYVIDRIMSVRQALQSLELAHFFDAYESGGLIQFAHRGAAGSQASVSADDLVDEGADLYRLTRMQESELPLSAKLSYLDANADYRSAVAEARRLAVRSQRVATAAMPLVTNQARAQAIAESWLHDSWAARERAALALPPSRLALEPGDVVTLSTDTREHALRILRSGDGEAKRIEALSLETESFAAPATPQRSLRPRAPASYGTPVAAFLDLPLLNGDEPPHVGYVAAALKPWPGAVAFYRSAEQTGFAQHGLALAPATMGTTQSVFPAGPVSRFDRANTVTVKLDGGTLQSVSETALLGGANLAAVETGPGMWEVFQFRDAQLVSAQTYQLSFLLRGQRGSEQAMQAALSAGARFVLLDGAVTPVEMAPDDIGLAFNWKYGPASRDISDPAYGSAVHGFAGVGLRPYAPAHVRGRRLASGDIEVSWVRRTRIGGDSWEGVEVPLGEEVESYEIDVLAGGAVKRTMSVTSPLVTYPLADQLADFGAQQAAYQLRVYQLGAAYGRGAPAAAVI